jgi:hypothetical protein
MLNYLLSRSVGHDAQVVALPPRSWSVGARDDEI